MSYSMDWRDDAKIETDNFYSDLFNGYIDPNKLLRTPDNTVVRNAIEVIKAFRESADFHEIIKYTDQIS